jgi:hypothetical protein
MSINGLNLPGLFDLAQLAIRPVAKEERILIAPWTRDGNFSRFLSLTSWSTVALADAMATKTRRAARLWFPEYFCDQSLWLLRQRNVELLFYPVDAQGRPKWDFLQDGVKKADLCDQHDLFMLEDAAHVLGPLQGIGEAGDATTYSLWKFFPAPNGAVLTVRPQDFLSESEISSAIEGIGKKKALGLRWAAKAFRRAFGADGGEELDPDFTKVTKSKPVGSGPGPSPISARMLNSVDFERIASRRQANDRYIRTYFNHVGGCEPFMEAVSSAPWLSAIRFDSPDRAGEVYRKLRGAGVSAEAWPPDLPEEASAPESSGVWLRSRVITLPCHQGLSPERLDKVFHNLNL